MRYMKWFHFRGFTKFLKNRKRHRDDISERFDEYRHLSLKQLSEKVKKNLRSCVCQKGTGLKIDDLFYIFDGNSLYPSALAVT